MISRLNGTDLKFFARASRKYRKAVRRAKRSRKAEKKLRFRISELSSISTLKWAWEEGFPFDENDYYMRGKIYFIKYVVKTGNVDLLRWLREVKNCEWDEYTCHEAAENGHLACLKYAHEKGCTWLARSCWDSARNEHIKEYLREHNCPRSSN